jgi:predicted PurR-regulated permease PerM
LILPPLAIELKGFVVNVLGNFDSLVEQPDHYWLMFNLPSTEVSQYIKQFSDLTLANSQTIISGFFKVFGGFVSVLVIFFVALFLNIQQNGVRHFIPFFIKEKNLLSATKFFEKIQNQVGSWFWAKTMSSVLVGLIIFIGLSVMKVNYALLLAVLAMLLNFIPFIGPMIASLPALLIAFFQSPLLVLLVLLLYFLTNIVIEGFIFIPLIMKREIQMNSALIIIFVLIGGKLGGILGIIISIPVAAIASLVWDEYRQRN